MPKKRSNINISKLQLVEINERKQFIQNDLQLNKEDALKAKFGVSLNPLLNKDINAIKIELGVKIDVKNNKNQFVEAAEFAYDFIFLYDGLKELIEQDSVHPELLLTCATIGYSTLRGIIFKEAQGSCVEKALIPILSGKELLAGLKTSKKEEK